MKRFFTREPASPNPREFYNKALVLAPLRNIHNVGGETIGNQIYLSEQFSISALRHEYGHFLDHKSLGYPKFIDYIKNPNVFL